MPGLATRRQHLGAGALRPRARTSHGTRQRRAAGLAAANAVTSLAQGRTGWTIPEINSIPKTYVACPGERAAAQVAMALLRAGVASAASFQTDAQGFVRSTLRDFVKRNGGPSIRKTFRLHLLLTTTLNEYSTRDDEFNPARLFLTLEPSEAGYFVAGPTLGILERAHPRLPPTFIHLVTGALNRWVRVYDHRDARERIEMLRDWYSADREFESFELPDVDGSVPNSLSERPLRPFELRRLLPTCGAQVQDWMQRAIAAESLSKGKARPIMTEEMEEELGDRNPPLPSLLAVFRSGDGIEACFDDEAQGMMEVSPEPNLIIPLDATNPAKVRRAFQILRAACLTLAKIAELVELLPGAKGPEESNGM